MSGGFELALWALLLIATATDLRWGKIPNALVFPFLAFGLIAKISFGSVHDFNLALAAVALAFFLFFPLWILKAFAAGDVKLLMAIGAVSDPRTVVVLGAGAIVIGSIVGGFLLVRTRGLRIALGSLKRHATTVAPMAKGASLRMPFAPAFLCAFFILKIAEVRQWHLW